MGASCTKNTKKNFDAHKLVTNEINPIFYRLRLNVEKPVNVKARMDNLQLLADDWRSDLLVHINRCHEELLKNLDGLKPLEIFQWSSKIKTDVESYGPYYWEDADTFFDAFLLTSLMEYINNQIIEKELEEPSRKWYNYIMRIKKEISDLNQKLESLEKERWDMRIKISSIQKEKDDIEKERNNLNKAVFSIKAELNALSKTNKISKCIVDIIGKLFRVSIKSQEETNEG